MTAETKERLERDLARKRQALEHAREAVRLTTNVAAEMVREIALTESMLAHEPVHTSGPPGAELNWEHVAGYHKHA